MAAVDRKQLTIFSAGEVLPALVILGCVLFLLLPGHETRGDLACRAHSYARARDEYRRALERPGMFAAAITLLPEPLRAAAVGFAAGQYDEPRRRSLLERLVAVTGRLGEREEHLRYARKLADRCPGGRHARRLLVEAYQWNAMYQEAIQLLASEERNAELGEQEASNLAECYMAIAAPAESIPILERLARETAKPEYRKRLANAYHAVFYQAKHATEAEGDQHAP
jgi:hypothetical protein